MTSVLHLVTQTRRHLLSAQREQLNKLAAPVDADDTTLTFQYDIASIQQGMYLEIGLELVYVWERNPTAKTVMVERAANGTTAAEHITNDLVTVNPRFPAAYVLDAINQDLADLSARGLPRVRTLTLTAAAASYGYNLTATDILEIYDVRYDPPGPENHYPKIRWRWMPSAPTADFAAGNALILDGIVQQGRPLHVIYFATYGQLTALTDVVETVAGLPPTAMDLPPLGAAARLMAVRDAKRAQIEAQPETRRADEVGVGSAARAAQTIMALREQRLGAEVARFRAKYPVLR